MRPPITLWQLRRALLILCAAVIALAIALFLSIQIEEVPMHGVMAERLNGQAGTAPLALPLVLFVAGTAGLLLTLTWQPTRKRR